MQLVQQDHKVQLVLQAQPAHKEKKEIQAQLVRRAQLVLLAQQVLMEKMELQEQLVLQAQWDHKAQQVHKEKLVQLVLREQLA